MDQMSQALEFPGRERLIAAIDAAVANDCQVALTKALRKALCKLISDPEVQLPGCVYEPVTDHYARRELYRSAEHGYSVVAMTWGPGQGTPIHDHSGMWCVEGVFDGALEITQYELTEFDHDRCRFQPVGTMQAVAGSAGSLIPPHEYHTIHNPSSEDCAVSLHIYRGVLSCCCTFAPTADGWYDRLKLDLPLDSEAPA